MNKVVMFLLNEVCGFFGELKYVTMYDDKNATIRFSTNDSEFELYVTRKDKEENKDGNIV